MKQRPYKITLEYYMLVVKMKDRQLKMERSSFSF